MSNPLSSLLNWLRPRSRPSLAAARRDHQSKEDRAGSAAGHSAKPLAFGRFKVEHEVGRGSMGAVYKGLDSTSGDVVAIKTLALQPGAASTEAQGDDPRQRFFREAQTVARLRHRDIVSVLGSGEQGGLAYMAMEYVEGKDLSWYANPARLLPVRDVLDVVARVADALAYAHSQGVVHRDVKPANIMVNLERGVVKVTDFGVARLADSSQTRSGVVLGTPAFMSPEQLAGSRADGRSDVYSLGVVLFNLLTGHLPHRATAMAELMFQIANQVPPDVREWRPGVPEALAHVVTLALEKRPEVRYANAAELAADLREVAARLPMERSAESSAYSLDAAPGAAAGHATGSARAI